MRRRRESQPVRVGTLIPKVLEELALEGARAGLRVAECWVTVVGADAANHCRPTLVRNGVLEVSADSSSWAQELRFRQPVILEGLRDQLGSEAPTDLRIRPA